MAYGDGTYPTELANKIGHIRIIEDPMIRRIVEAFQDTRPSLAAGTPAPSGAVDLEAPATLSQVVTVDGGHQAVPNVARPERQVGFVQVAVQLVKAATIEQLKLNPMADPRDVQRTLGQYTHHIFAAVPVAGLNMAGLTLQQSLREAIHRFLDHYDLYEALAYLVYRQWEADQLDSPAMDCLHCGRRFDLPRHSLAFNCPHCSHGHRLSDYLGLCDQDAEDRSTMETVSGLRSVLETLALFSLIIRFRDQPRVLAGTLFLLDGPLLLRAQLSRLVEPIRGLLAHQAGRDMPVFLVGIEKSGELRSFADSYAEHLTRPGQFLLPSTQFLVEQVNGRAFDPATYRNRVSYGAKVIVRVAPHHVLVTNVPTGQFVLSPQPQDLLGFDPSVRLLGRLISYRYANALIPIVLANTAASIANQPSGSILGQFVDRLIRPDA